MAITLDDIKKLRDQSGAGMGDVKAALEEANGDNEKAYEILRARGMAKLAKRGERAANNGYIGVYSHNGQIVGIAVVNSETDFASKSEDFQVLAKEMAMQVAAQNPKYINKEDVPEEVLAKEKAIYMEEIKGEGKPENIAEKIAEGKLQKYFEEVVLMEQAWIKDDSKKMKDLLNETLSKIGEKIVVSKIDRIVI